MNNGGWVKLHRSAFDHGLFEGDEYSRRDAWLWLCSNAAFEERTVWPNARPVVLKRGQLCHSIRFLAEKWKWPKSTVDRFLRRLETGTMIRREAGRGQLTITICNYDKFQGRDEAVRDSDGAATGTQTGRQRDKDKELKNEKKEEDSLDHADLLAWPRDAFERFWQAYPHKVGKAAAQKWWRRHQTKPPVEFGCLMDGLRRYVAEKPPDRSWCNPLTWLNQGRWNDQPDNTPSLFDDRHSRNSAEERDSSFARGFEAVERRHEASAPGHWDPNPPPDLAFPDEQDG